MAGLVIHFIGCGRLGKSIASLIHKTKAAQIDGVVTVSYPSAIQAVKFIGEGKAFKNLSELPPGDIYFITTPDDLIQSVCEELVAKNNLKTGSIVLHCSGSLNSAILEKAKQAGCYTASLHPVKSFASPQSSIDSFPGTYCALEGDSQALNEISNLVEKIGGKPFLIQKESKILYHAASVLANNYLVTLHHQALHCYKLAGIDDKTAEILTSQLMSEAFSNFSKLPHQAALTGPIQRGDAKTIKNHLQALSAHPTLDEIYRALGKAALALTQHGEDKKAELNKLLKAAR